MDGQEQHYNLSSIIKLLQKTTKNYVEEYHSIQKSDLLGKLAD